LSVIELLARFSGVCSVSVESASGSPFFEFGPLKSDAASRVAHASIYTADWAQSGRAVDPAAVRKRCIQISQRWRRVAPEIVKAAALPPSALPRMLACRPCGVAARARGFTAAYCGHRYICPFCWGRRAQDVWRRLHVTLFPPESDADARGDVTVALHRYAYEAADGGGVAEACRMRLGASPPSLVFAVPPRQRDYRVRRFAAALDLLFGDYSPSPSGRGLVRLHQLYVYPTDVFPRIPTHAGASSLHSHVVRPTQSELVDAVGQFFRYPFGLLFGPPAVLEDYLAARAGRRLFEQYGSLRGILEPAEDSGGATEASTPRPARAHRPRIDYAPVATRGRGTPVPVGV